MLTMVFLHPDRSSPCPLKIPSFSATDVHLGAGGDAVALVHALQRHAVQGERSWGSKLATTGWAYRQGYFFY